MTDTPILDRIEDRRPFLGKLARFFTSYAKKATWTSAVGTVVTDTLLNNVGVDPEAAQGPIQWLATLPWWIQIPSLLLVFFALPYFPANGRARR